MRRNEKYHQITSDEDHLNRKWLEIKLVLKKKVKFTYITGGSLLVESANSVNVGKTGSLKRFNSKHTERLI